MAYLKGGTVVDGNLYVEGGLRVKVVTDSSGKPLPHLADSYSSNPLRLIKFTDENGSISYSLFSENFTDDTELVQVKIHDKKEFKLSFEKSNPKMTLEIDAGSISVSPKELEFTGLIEVNEEDGEYLVNNKFYRKLNSLASPPEFPDIFCYVPKITQANT